MEDKILTEEQFDKLYCAERTLSYLVSAYQNGLGEVLSDKTKISLTESIKSTVKEISDLFNS